MYRSPKGGIGVQPLFDDLDEVAVRESLAEAGFTIVGEPELHSGNTWPITESQRGRPLPLEVIAEAFPTRERVTPDELSAWLTSELRKVRGFEGCTVRPPTPVPLDVMGCNWSPVVYATLGEGVDRGKCERALQGPLERARERFNLR
jgi:hypothetical protein